MDVAIVGAGISGILTGYTLSRNRRICRVDIFEKRKDVSPRRHCTGLVSRSTLKRMPFADKFIVNSYSCINIVMFEGTDFNIYLEKDAVYKIDRVAHESYLIDIVRDKGIEVRFNNNVTSLEKINEKIHVISVGSITKNELYDIVIVAEGFPSRLAKLAGLKSYRECLKGFQVEVFFSRKTSNLAIDNLYVATSFKRFLSEFGWFVPISDRKAVIGVALPSGNVLNSVYVYMKFFEKKFGIEISKIENGYGGAILRGYPIDIVKKDFLGIGDAIGAVKSISGGGLYAISILSKIYGENIHRNDLIKEKVEMLINELKKQYRVYYILYRTFSKINMNWTKIFKKVSIDIGNEYYYDHHEGILTKAVLSLFK
ncbi:MAG: NAD(P)-binding protein [Ignisphaera sp.]|uniref:NAD(P)/FAD-dependent oxidoreductase n=1 Tax=Ignisphaera aggregans TaxID=334771 RepID=A0A7J3MZZ0_9CREN